MANNAVTAAKVVAGQVVKSINGLFDNVTLVAGSNITLTPFGNNLTIAASVGGLTLPFSGTGSAGLAVFSVINTGSGYSVLGTGTSNVGVFGTSSSTGVYGSGTGGVGVWGITSGQNPAVAGTNNNGTCGGRVHKKSGLFDAGAWLGLTWCFSM